MGKTTETAASGSRYSNLTKSFNGCLRFLLTEFSFEVSRSNLLLGFAFQLQSNSRMD